ncbi:hypothetical protein [Micromonospora sp. NPDC004551]|uniref:hypothetical protein n=1 Tax=Micromonospora sp. NPDC004551 TaxID=3154284 RepID=UPI0033B2F260
MRANGIPAWLAIVVACIGVVGVLLGGLLQAWRDDRRWNRERENERERWRREEKARWFDKKTETFNHFLTAMDDWTIRLFHPSFAIEVRKPEELAQRASQYLTQIRWMADPATINACARYWRSLSSVSADRADDTPGPTDERTKFFIKLEPAWREIFDKMGPSQELDEAIKTGVRVFHIECIQAVRKELLPEQN